MILKNKVVPLVSVGVPSRVRKVKSADHHIIPGMSEAVVDVFVDRWEDDSESNNLLVEPIRELAASYSAVMAPSLVDATQNCTVKIRIMNPTLNPISLKQDQVLGHADPIAEEVLTLFEFEDPSERDNNANIRRISPVPVPSSQILESSSDSPVIPDYLTDMLKGAHGICDTDEHKTQIAGLLHKYVGAFSRDEYDLGLTHISEHVIETADANPIKQPPRRVPMAFAGEDKEAIEKLVQQGSVRPSTSPWASPIVLVRKKDGKVRTCVDYRRLNAVTRKDAFPIPRVHDCLDAMAESVLFSTMDITAAYNQIPVRTEDIPKTAFCSRYGLMEFVTSLPKNHGDSVGCFTVV